MKSKVRHSFCPISIVAALRSKNNDYSGYISDGDEQKQLMDLLNEYNDHPLLETDYVKGICSSKKEDLKKFIKDNEIEMNIPIPGRNEIVMIGLFYFLAEWLEKGKKKDYTLDGTKYKYALMEDGIVHYVMKNHSDVFEVKTKDSKVSVFLTQDISIEEITIDEIKNVSKLDFDSASRGSQNLAFPMVDFKEEFGLSELIGLNIDGYIVDEAKQLNKLKLNEKRIEARSETMMKAKRAIIRHDPYVITKPFLVWVKHKYSNLPAAVFYLDKKCWKAN